MRYYHDKQGSKLIFIVILLLGTYLAFFGFNITAAYQYTITQSVQFLQVLGITVP